MKVNDKNKKKFLKQLKKLKMSKVLLGATGQHSGSNISNSSLWLIHEFGSPKNNLPGRHAIAKTFTNTENLDLYSNNFKELVKKHYKPTKGGFDISAILSGLGETLRASIVSTVLSGVSPDIKPASRAKRRGSKTTPPLYDTRQMIDSLTFAVDVK